MSNGRPRPSTSIRRSPLADSGMSREATGDGALVEFRSVVDAVRCAIEVQNATHDELAATMAIRRLVEESA
jgi:class 3 adenylate cyclase